MIIDLPSAALSTIGVAVATHAIAYLVQKGKDEQWRKDTEERIDEMEKSLDKMNEVHNLERLNSQRLTQLSDDFKEHKSYTERQFRELGNKIDSSSKAVISALVNFTGK